MFKPLNQYLTSGRDFSSSQSKKDRDFWQFLKIMSLWGEIVGPMVYEHTRPNKIDGDTLVIMVNHPAFSHELKNLQEKIIFEIGNKIPYWQKRLKSLRFFYGQISKELENNEETKETLRSNEASQLFGPNFSLKKNQHLKDYSFIDVEFQDLLASIHAQVDLDD